jgi:ketosteroid isomerase-like protein
MKELVKVLSIALVTLSAVQILSAYQDVGLDSDTVKAVTELDHRWVASATARDTVTLQKIFADKFVEVHGGGEVVDKATQIAQIKASTTKLDVHPEDIVVRYAAPDIAVLTDTTVIRGARLGKDITGKYRVLRVFVKQNGEWHAAGAGLTKLPAE